MKDAEIWRESLQIPSCIPFLLSDTSGNAIRPPSHLLINPRAFVSYPFSQSPSYTMRSFVFSASRASVRSTSDEKLVGTGSAWNMIEALKAKLLIKSDDTKEQSGAPRPVNLLVSAPVKALELACGWDWKTSVRRKLRRMDKCPFHLILTSKTIPTSLSTFTGTHHPTLARLASSHLHRLPRTLHLGHVSWTGGNRNADIERCSVAYGPRMLLVVRTKQRRVHRSRALIFCNWSTKVEALGEPLSERSIPNITLTSNTSSRSRGSNRHLASFSSVSPTPMLIEMRHSCLSLPLSYLVV